MNHPGRSLRKAALFFAAVTALSGCVSAGKYRELEKFHAESLDESEKTKQALAAAEARISELNGKLGIVDTQRSKLESSVGEMKTAMEELQKRKLQTEKRLAEYRELTAKFSKLVSAGKLSVKVSRGRMTVALSTDILFPSGSAKLSPAGILALKEVTKLLISLDGRKYQIEGHTDNVPIKTSSYPSNWELASARAMTVVKTMLEAGMPGERISGASFGETQPAGSNFTDEGRSQNRRIEIVIVPDISGLPGTEELSKIVAGDEPKNP